MKSIQENIDTVEYLESVLGEPTYKCPGVSIYQGDCLNLMRRLPLSIINLTVTSPPYNIGKEYEKIVENGGYLNWCEKWIGEVFRITTSGGAFWLNLGYFSVPDLAKAIPIAYLLWDRIPFYLIQEIVWHYGAGVSCKNSFSPRNEKFLWYVKDSDNYTFNLDEVRDTNVKYPNQKKNGKLKCNLLGKNPTDVWQFPKVTSGKNRSSIERTSHPAQFPVAVIERIIKSCSNPGDLIFDPFMGSGSVAEAALRTNRQAVGFEIEKSYITIIQQRIDNYLKIKSIEEAQFTLF